jgi:hypothetical protein
MVAHTRSANSIVVVGAQKRVRRLVLGEPSQQFVDSQGLREVPVVRKYPPALSAFELNEFRAVRTDRYGTLRKPGRPILNVLTIRLQLIDFGSHEVIAQANESN